MAEIISQFDKNLVQKIEAPDTSKIKEDLEQHIIGQPEAVQFWADVIYRVMSNAPKLRKGPLSIVMEIGPSGTGKTEIVKKVAEYLATQSSYQQISYKIRSREEKSNILRIDCGEYQQEHEVSKVIGSPPGYVGHDITPRLSQSEIDSHAIAITPEKHITIILLDEIEKAHPKLNITFLGGLDYGVITLGDNSKTDLKNCIVAFTSNLGNQEITKRIASGEILTVEDQKKIRQKAMGKHFTPEQLSRMGGETNTILFNELSKEMSMKILISKLNNLESLYNQQGMTIIFQLTQSGLEKLLELCYSATEGVRQLERMIDQYIVSKLSNLPQVDSPIPVVIDAANGAVELYIPKPTDKKNDAQTISNTRSTIETKGKKMPKDGENRQLTQSEEIKDIGEAHTVWRHYVALIEQIAQIAARSLAKYPSLAEKIIQQGKQHELNYDLLQHFQSAPRDKSSEISIDDVQLNFRIFTTKMSQMMVDHFVDQQQLAESEKVKLIQEIVMQEYRALENYYELNKLAQGFKKIFKIED